MFAHINMLFRLIYVTRIIFLLKKNKPKMNYSLLMAYFQAHILSKLAQFNTFKTMVLGHVDTFLNTFGVQEYMFKGVKVFKTLAQNAFILALVFSRVIIRFL